MKSLSNKTVFKGDKFVFVLLSAKMMTVKEQLVTELHKPARKRFPRRKVEVRSLNEFLHRDLVELIPYAEFKKDFDIF